MIKGINAYYISLFSLRSQNENCPTERTDVLKPYSQQGFKEKILKKFNKNYCILYVYVLKSN